MVKKFFTFLWILITVFGFSVSQNGIEYYSAAELSYKSGDYKTALDNYERAIAVDKTLEGYDPQIKFKMGVSAYMIGNYDKARNYLASYDNEFVQELLESISSRQAQDEWKRWIKQNNPTTAEITQLETSTTVTVVQPSNNNNTLILVIIFSMTFVVLLFAEVRIYRVKRKVIELPLKPSQESLGQSSEISLESEIPSETKQAVSEEASSELELIPKDAKIIDFEQLINSEIDVFKDILEQFDILEKEEKATEESQTEESSREKLLEEVLDESKELIEEIKVISSDFDEKEEQNIPLVELEGLEAELVEKVRNVREKILTNVTPLSEERSVEEFEELQKGFEVFDEIENLSENDTELLVKKLMQLPRGEDN